MTPENPKPSDFEYYAKQMLDLVPDDGTPVGNVTLKQKLIEIDRQFWEIEDNYWSVRNELVNRGRLLLGKGKGGSVRKPSGVDGQGPAPDGGASEEKDSIQEQDLYEPMFRVVESTWFRVRRFNDSVAELTANQGRRATGGRWSRPDIIAAGIRVLPYVPTKALELVTFEIKPYTALDVMAVYEALAHRRAAHRANVLVYMPEKVRQRLEEDLEIVRLEAENHGIGLIVAAKPDAYDEWEELAEAVFTAPDPVRMNDLIATQVSQKFREKFVTWLR